MENYDVIIVGAGIAGTGLAYNLGQECPNLRVLVMDKKEPGANAAYGYRNTTEEIVKEYNLPYEHIYKGIKVGAYDKTYFTINKKFYFCNYKKICKKLLEKSKANFSIENAKDIENNVLITNSKRYNFKYLIDCSGHNFFAKKLLNQTLPFRYFISNTRLLKNKLKDTDYFYYQFSDSNYIEELYPLKNNTLQADWAYAKNINFDLIKPENKNLLNKYIKDPKIIKETKIVIPTTPVLPIVYNNIAFLGDSFGNASTSSAEGIRNILDTSKILCSAIKQKELKIYEKIWVKKYLKGYLKFLVTKLDTYNNPKIFLKIKKTPTRTQLLPVISKYPNIFEKILFCDPSLKLPSEISKEYSNIAKFFQLYYYIYLKLKYAIM